jgi:hypothetical protein
MRFSASLRLRPVRIGFMVNPGDFESVRRCFRVNTCLWGGQYNPIIPALRRPPRRWHVQDWRPKARDITSGYVRFFEPDVVVEAEQGLAKKVGWEPGERYVQAARLVSLDEFINTDNAGRVNFASGVDVTAIHAHRYHEEFKFQLKREEKFATMQAPPKQDAFFELFVGSFPSYPKLAYIERQYKEAYGPLELPHTVDTFLSLMDEFTIRRTGSRAPVWRRTSAAIPTSLFSYSIRPTGKTSSMRGTYDCSSGTSF